MNYTWDVWIPFPQISQEKKKYVNAWTTPDVELNNWIQTDADVFDMLFSLFLTLWS